MVSESESCVNAAMVLIVIFDVTTRLHRVASSSFLKVVLACLPAFALILLIPLMLDEIQRIKKVSSS